MRHRCSMDGARTLLYDPRRDGPAGMAGTAPIGRAYVVGNPMDQTVPLNEANMIRDRYRQQYEPVYEAMRKRREAATRRNAGRGQAEALDRWSRLGAAAAPVVGGAIGAGVGAGIGGAAGGVGALPGAAAGMGVGSALGQGVGGLLGIFGNEQVRDYQEGDEQDAAYRAALMQALASM